MRHLGRISVAGAILAVLVIPTTVVVSLAQSKFKPPPPGTQTVSPAPPGADYKSNPAPPEKTEDPDGTPNTSLEGMTIQEAEKVLDPYDDPGILVCKNESGSFDLVTVRWISDQAAEDFQKLSPDERRATELINDGGAC